LGQAPAHPNKAMMIVPALQPTAAAQAGFQVQAPESGGG
jgi:hypothetical protein